ncbi:MAG: ArsR family transcriptional regulator, partial [Gemmatimonadetes bacterium]|nr:ArsR family transcriptional regulator [Gemmatimonadota bacterium]NIQ57514.1 ArsR family transcriptional regulator [Gemmatimonadota bacterium]NIU77669.1 ArsR family transcriptional regulator [Gammaproteobacteria bacterium]NIX46838.1 ArsR family transcriptional regulator [Gemmatimonadota bacterium]
LLARAGATGKRLATAGISAEVRLAEPADFNDFVEDLARAVGEVISRYHVDRGGRTFR